MVGTCTVSPPTTTITTATVQLPAASTNVATGQQHAYWPHATCHMQEHAAAIHNHTIHDNSTIDEMRNRAEFHIEMLNNAEELRIVMPYCDG